MSSVMVAVISCLEKSTMRLWNDNIMYNAYNTEVSYKNTYSSPLIMVLVMVHGYVFLKSFLANAVFHVQLV